MRLVLPLLLAAPLLAASLPAARAQAPAPRSQAIANAVTPPSTGEQSCDEMVRAWRRCIDASPKPPVDKVQANTEVDRFVRDVFDARGPHRNDLSQACGRALPGWGLMVENGTCGNNITGARDDQATRVGTPPESTTPQRRAPR